MRTIKLTTGAALTLDGDLLTVLEALYKEISAKHELQSTFEDMAREIQHIIEQMTDEERRHYLSESLFLNIVSYENERLGAYVKKLHARSRCPSTTSPPGSPAPGRGARWCSSATAAWSAAAPIPTASASSATCGPRRCRRSGPARRRPRLRRDIVAGGSKFCGDCPLKLPLKKDEAAAAAPARRRAAALAPLHRVHRRLQHLVQPGLLRAGDRHHAHAPGRACSTTTSSPASSTRPAPSVGRIDFFNYGEAFLHKRALDMVEYIKSRYPHVYLYTSTNGLALTEDGARRLARSGIDEVTFSIDGATRRELRAVPPARRLRQGDPQPDGARATRSGRTASTCRS